MLQTFQMALVLCVKIRQCKVCVGGQIVMCFCSSWIKTLVAMTIYSFHRLIMGKVEIDNFCLVIGGI